MVGFHCKRCGRPFLVMRNTAHDIDGGADEIAHYESTGHRLEFIETDISDLDNWCNCSTEELNT